MSKIENLDQNFSLKKIDKDTINIKVFSNDILLSVVGEFNKNLNELEKLTKTKIFFRGNSITIKGKNDKIDEAADAIKFLINKCIKTSVIEDQDISLSVKSKDKNHKADVNSLEQLIKTPKKTVIARSKKQSDYIKALSNNDITMAFGPAGTGKSFLAVSVAMTMLFEKRVEKVILSRPAVEAGEKLGFLPGDMKRKLILILDLCTTPLYDLFGLKKLIKR